MKEIIKAINDKAVESSLGWRIDILSPESFQYREQDKTIAFEIEDCPDPMGEIEWKIYVPAKCKWQGANHEETINREKMDEILDRINTAFWKLDMKIKEIV